MNSVIEYKHFFSLIPYINTLDFISKKKFKGIIKEDKHFGRWGVHNDPFFVQIHNDILPIAESTFNEKLKPSYCYLSMYGSDGVLIEHQDRDPCKYTIDYCINCDKDWDIIIDNKKYTSTPNNALCYSGTDLYHYRDKIKGKFMNLVFFHFVPVDYEGELR